MKRKPAAKRRGYDLGGYVDMSLAPKPLNTAPPNSKQESQDVSSGVNQALSMGSAIMGMQKASGGGGGSSGPDPTGGAKGGRIKRTVGPRIGKDDGLIPAQRGEYIVRKSAVKKLGTKALNTINKGKLPSARNR